MSEQPISREVKGPYSDGRRIPREIVEAYLNNEWIEKGDLPFLEEVYRALLAADDALKDAEAHLEELREAWVRGIIHESDDLGGTRSNRNVEVLAIARAAMLPTSEEVK